MEGTGALKAGDDAPPPGFNARQRRSSVSGLAAERTAPKPRARGGGLQGGRRASIVQVERRNSMVREEAITSEKVVEGALEALVQAKFGGYRSEKEAEQARKRAEQRRKDELAAAEDAINTPFAMPDSAVIANMGRKDQRRQSGGGSLVQEVFKKRGDQKMRVTEQGLTKLRLRSEQAGANQQWQDHRREMEEWVEEESESRQETATPDAVPEKEKSAKKVVSQVYRLALGRAVDPCGLRHYTQAMMEGELDRDGLIRKLTESHEYQEKAARKLAKLPVERIVYENRFYPWIAVEDEADEEAGTVQWVENDSIAKEKVWQTGAVRGNNRGAEVFNSKIFYSTMDNWTMVTVHKPMKKGVHWFSMTKIMQSPSGNKARIGVVVRDCELDSDIKRDLFKDRAWYLDEDGCFWNGHFFISGGPTYYARGSVVTFKLDLFAHKVSCWVAFKPKLLPGSGGVPQDDQLGTLCGTADLVPGKQYFAMVDDLYGGSGFEISDFVTEGPKENVDKERYIRERIWDKQQKLGLEPTEPARGHTGGRAELKGPLSTPKSTARSPSSAGSAAQSPEGSSPHSPADGAEDHPKRKVQHPPHPGRKRMDGPSPTFLTRVVAPGEPPPRPLLL